MTRPKSALWIFNHYAQPPSGSTGTRHYDLGRELLRRGISVTIFASSVSHVSGREEHLAGWRLFRSESIDRVRFVWVRTVPYRGNGVFRALNMLSYAVVVVMVQALIRERPQSVIGSTVHPFAAIAAWFVARLRGASYFYEVRDLWPQTLIDMGTLTRRSLIARVLWGLESFCVRQSAAVITVLPNVERYLLDRQLKPRRVVHVPNGTMMEGQTGGTSASLGPEAHATLAEWRRDGRFTIVYLGAHGPANGLEVLLVAAGIAEERMPGGVGLMLIGDGPAKPMLMRLARAQGLKNVAFSEPVPKSSVRAILQRFDAAVFHLRDVDVFRFGISPNKLVDYMAACLPVIFACRAANNPIAEVNAGVAARPDDPDAAAEAFLGLAKRSRHELQAMGLRGRRYAEAHHDVRKSAERLASLITS